MRNQGNFHNRNAGCAVALRCVKYFSVHIYLTCSCSAAFCMHTNPAAMLSVHSENMTVKFSSIYQERKYGCGGELFGL